MNRLLRLDENIGASEFSQDGLPAWFDNLLPEGQFRDLVEASRRGLPSSPDRVAEGGALLETLGLDLPGAVQVLRAGTPVSARLEDSDRVELLGPHEDSPSSLLRFSVAGVGLKLSLLRSGRWFTAPARGARGDWLVKLPDRVFPSLPTNEFAVMSLAHNVGIDVPEISLVTRDEVETTGDALWSGESLAFAIKRFDRTPDGPVHIEDLAQVRGVPPAEKYSGNFETVAGLVYRGHDEGALEQFVRRLAFSILVGNSDAHLKNWSLIYPDRRNATLSPAYDLVSVIAYADLGIDTNLALRFANRRRFEDVRLHNFSRVARKLGTSAPLDEIASDTIRRAMNSWDVLDGLHAGETGIRRTIRDHASAMVAQLLGTRW